jgi:hypothetical protein
VSYYTHAKNAVYLQQLKYKYQTTKGNNMRTYEQALQHYELCKAPKRSKRWLSMPDSPRYLRNVSADHMGIHKTNDGAIYYRLYNTNVATFYPPESNGDRKVVMQYYASQTTNIFMYEQNLNYHSLTTTKGEEVKVPYVASWDYSTQQHKPSAELWFNSDGLLIKERSSHRDIYTFKSSAEDKQKRKDFKAKVDTLMTLAMFRLPEYRANVTIDENLGQPFGTAWRNAPRSIDHFERTAKDLGADNTEHPQYIEAFLDLGQAVYDISASHKVYAYVTEGYKWAGGLFRTWGKQGAELQAMLDKQHEIADEVTAEEFKKAMTSRLLGVASLKTGSVKTPWGQFMPSIPRKYFV